jgi:hypothetical protein
MREELTPARFRERFALAAFPDGGLVFDLETGSYSRLNRSGSAVLEELGRQPDVASTIAAIAGRLRVPSSEAVTHLRNMTSALGAPGVRQERPGPFRYRTTDDGRYVFTFDERELLAVEGDGEAIRLLSPLEKLPVALSDCLRLVAPKILFLRGFTVLHASCCFRGEGLLAFSGKSGAGKTTTAQSFAAHGSALVSEDMVVFDKSFETPSVFLEGEARLRRWALDTAASLSAAGEAIRTQELLPAATGAVAPLRLMWFLDATRRLEKLDARPLSRTDTLLRIMTNHFLGAKDRESWRRYISAGQGIASAVTGYDLDLPSGLERLDEAVASYTLSSTS